MTRYVFLNGDYLPQEEASIPVMDRGFLFGDAIYEVTAMIDGRMIDNDAHLARLQRSLRQIDIALPMPLDDIRNMQIELVRKNAMRDGTIYLQVTRGVEERNFLASHDLTPSLIAFTQPKKLYDTPQQKHGVSVALLEDPRWNRRDIKTVMLLGQVLAKKQATADGYDDVWMHENGCVTEGGSSTAFIITRDGEIVTRPASHAVLPGCTAKAVQALAGEEGLRILARPIQVEELGSAVEAFLTSASSFVQPVVRVGKQVIGDGTPGPLTRRLQALYLSAARSGEAVL
jgi:D-alanine transaminase